MATICKFFDFFLKFVIERWICLAVIFAGSIIANFNSGLLVAGFVVAFVSTLCVLVQWLSVHHSTWLHYLYLVRVPFIGGLILFFFPFIANYVASKFLQNLFVMESAIQLIAVMVFAVVTSVNIMLMIRNIIIWKEPGLYKKDNNSLTKFLLVIPFVVIPLPTWFFLELDFNPKDNWLLIGAAVVILVLLGWFAIEKIYVSEYLTKKIEKYIINKSKENKLSEELEKAKNEASEAIDKFNSDKRRNEQQKQQIELLKQKLQSSQPTKEEEEQRSKEEEQRSKEEEKLEKKFSESGKSILSSRQEIEKIGQKLEVESNNLKETLKALRNSINTIYLIQLSIGFVLYVLSMWLNCPNPQGEIKASREWQAPTLLYALLIIWVVTVVLGGLTTLADEWFDKEKADNASKLPKKYIFRVPVILSLIPLFAIMYGFFNVDHYFKLTASKLKDSQVLISNYQKNFKTAIGNRLCPEDFKEEQRCNKEQSLVVVAASGGGIQASGWTAQVLAGLQDETLGIGKDFTKAIGLISSVSGGSVGTMFYLDYLDELKLKNLDELKLKNPDVLTESEKAMIQREKEKILLKFIQNATDDWLDSVGWGLAYPDLLRLIGFPWRVDKYKYIDRGYALEKDWQRSLENPNKTLDDWYDEAKKGEIPIPVFNSTLVENGRRFFISPMKFIPEQMKYYLLNDSELNDSTLSEETKQKIKDSKALDFRTLYNCGTPDKPKVCNLDVISAARLSATFPYVSPMARNYIEGKDKGDNLIKVKEDDKKGTKQNYHMADGGFFDNAGAFTAIEWLDEFLEYKPEDKDKLECKEENYKCLNIKKVMLVQINAFPEILLEPEQKGNLGFLTVLAGPLNALNGVRDSTQVARNIQAVKFLEDKWNNNGKGISIKHFTISFLQKNAKGEEYNQPLSWRLSQKQKNNLKDAWEEPESIIRDEVKCMNFFWFYDHSELNDLKDTEKIKKIQADLVENRYLLGGSKEIDGIVGDKTRNAFAKFNAFTKFEDKYSNSTIEKIEQEFNKCEWVTDKP